MLILALDTTTRTGSVAILRDGAVVLERAGDSARTHAQRTPGDVMAACANAGLAIEEIDLFAVAAGPGSFTGLRIGIAAVQGLATAYGRMVAPVGTLEAIALASGHAGRVCVWMDAQRDEVFAQVFDVARDAGAAAVTPLSPAVSISPGGALAAHSPWLDAAAFHGDGAVRYRDVIVERHGQDVRVANDVPPLAGAVGKLASQDPGRAVLPHAVVPVYVRRPDAEIARDRRPGS